MVYAVYLRVSTADQNTENQKIALENYIKRLNSDVVWFQEKESTRKTRPVKEQLKRRALAGEFKGIIIWRLDRWARSLPELILDLEEFTKHNVTFISVSDLGVVDYSSLTGRVTVQILGILAEFERGLIRQRTIEGLERAKRQGKKLGRPKGAKDKKKRRTAGYRGNKNSVKRNKKPPSGFAQALEVESMKNKKTEVC